MSRNYSFIISLEKSINGPVLLVSNLFNVYYIFSCYINCTRLLFYNPITSFKQISVNPLNFSKCLKNV